jgi:hypothetical protein
MAHPAGESNSEALRLDFDRRLMLQFCGSELCFSTGTQDDSQRQTYAEPGGPVAGSRRASSLSIRLPSISTISKRHPS